MSALCDIAVGFFFRNVCFQHICRKVGKAKEVRDNKDRTETRIIVRKNKEFLALIKTYLVISSWPTDKILLLHYSS